MKNVKYVKNGKNGVSLATLRLGETFRYPNNVVVMMVINADVPRHRMMLVVDITTGATQFIVDDSAVVPVEPIGPIEFQDKQVF